MPECLVGQTYGRLTILEELPGVKGKMRMVKCACECGNITIVRKAHIKNGRTRSCGCYRRQREENMIGRRFGKLVVQEITGCHEYGHLRRRAKCLCDCGNTTVPTTAALLRGNTSSCGCRRDQYEKLSGSQSPHFTGHGQISGTLWGQFVAGAKRRHLMFTIDLPYAWTLFEQQGGRCVFTNLELVACGPREKVTASLDRIDSQQGYVPGNVQWVHKIVNMMRGSYSVARFMSVCLLVAQRQGWRPKKDQYELPTML